MHRPPSEFGIIRAFSLAFSQFGEGAMRGLLYKSLGYAILSLALAFAVGLFGFQYLPVTGHDWVDGSLRLLSSAALAIALFLLFPILAILCATLFLDDVAILVERRHYPGHPPGQSLTLAGAWRGALRFAAVTIGLNLLILPLYPLSLFFPPLAPALYYGLNGYLFGREYFEFAALRHVERKGMERLRRRYFWPLWIFGGMVAFLMTIPVVNLLAPLLAAAAAVHLYRMYQGTLDGSGNSGSK